MTGQAERTSPPGLAEPSRAPDSRDAFAEMFDAHAQHLFDYCCALTGDRGRAASATQATLIAAHSLAGRLNDTSRMRAFVLALGRWECLSGGHSQGGQSGSAATRPDGSNDIAAALAFVDEADDDVVDADTGELTLSDFEAASGLSLHAMLQALPREDRELLDLLYRHDVTVTDLAALLGVRAARVPGMLAAARAKFAAKASETAGTAADGTASPDVQAEQLSALRLASLPPSIWRRTARVVMDPRFRSYREAVSAHAEHLGPDGFPVQGAPTPSGRRLLMSSALMAGLLLAPAAAGGAVYAAVSTLAHVISHEHGVAVTPGDPGAGGSATGGSSGTGRGHAEAKGSGSKAKGHQAVGLPPQPRTSTSRPARKRSATPVPTSRYSSPSSPWPSQSSTPSGSSTPISTPTPTPTASPTPAAGA